LLVTMGSVITESRDCSPEIRTRLDIARSVIKIFGHSVEREIIKLCSEA